uniref:Transcriptional regulator n=1 Tax=Elaeophora elaphi TaxID=1147741 RepID=A0A0R3RQE6_9BILA
MKNICAKNQSYELTLEGQLCLSQKQLNHLIR